MKNKIFRLLAAVMLAAAVVFVAVAVNHPEMSWPWPLPATYALYGAYLALMAVFFIVSIRRLQRKTKWMISAAVVLVILAKVVSLSLAYFRF